MLGRALVDGAHNGPSLQAAITVAAERLAPGWTLILGTARDKEIDEMMAAIPAGVPVIRCGFASPRARGEADWPDAARSWPWHADVAAALAAAPGQVLVAGSLYLAGEALQVLR
jgi:folylpolyglutamate synthase/dihydropteroate synthase